MSSNDGPPTATGYALETIRKNIITGRYPPESKLDQKKLADELGISLIPVRESLRQLDVEGIVKIRPRKGAFVAKLSVEELKETYLIREVLEELIAQLAVPECTADDLERLKELLVDMERATEQEEYGRLLELNRAFHFTLYEAADRSILLQFITSLWDRSSFYRQLYTYIPDRAPQALREHKEIFAAVEEEDAIAAGQAVRNNVRQTVLGIVDKLEAGGQS